MSMRSSGPTRDMETRRGYEWLRDHFTQGGSAFVNCVNPSSARISDEEHSAAFAMREWIGAGWGVDYVYAASSAAEALTDDTGTAINWPRPEVVAALNEPEPSDAAGFVLYGASERLGKAPLSRYRAEREVATMLDTWTERVLSALNEEMGRQPLGYAIVVGVMHPVLAAELAIALAYLVDPSANVEVALTTHLGFAEAFHITFDEAAVEVEYLTQQRFAEPYEE